MIIGPISISLYFSSSYCRAELHSEVFKSLVISFNACGIRCLSLFNIKQVQIESVP